MFRILDAERAKKDPQLSPLAPKPGQAPPEPRLQARQLPVETERPFAPLTLHQAEYAKELEKLNSYGWVDEDNGIVHIPIDHAKKLILERGLPVREGAQ
jgi:hypothetical protein